MFILENVTCGNIGFGFDVMIPRVTTTIVTLIKIGIPVLLIIFGMMDLGKAVMAQKDDDIKKGQKTFINRLIQAAIVFFVVFIIQIVVGLLANSSDQKNITECIDCFISDTSKCPAWK